ncbi:MAG: hypothetical protein AAF431_19540 [Pseudomonadota bacterium]
MRSIIVLSISMLVISPALAQLEEIVVTASKSTGGYYDMPAVTLKKKADFLVQSIQLVNDSRSDVLRSTEIRKTIANLIKSSERINGIELSYGEGFLVPVNLNDDSLQIIEDNKRIDTSYVNVFVKVAIDPNQSTKKQISQLRQFIQGAKLAGRTEILARGDIGLSIIGPEQYRYEILSKIAEENQKMISAVGGTCEIILSGLQGRVEWERTGVDELTLYIAYGAELECQ